MVHLRYLQHQDGSGVRGPRDKRAVPGLLNLVPDRFCDLLNSRIEAFQRLFVIFWISISSLCAAMASEISLLVLNTRIDINDLLLISDFGK